MHQPAPELVFGSTLIKELYTATQLLSAGVSRITERGWFAAEPAVAFTCLSSGVERLLKLTYGMGVQEAQNPFPTNKELRQLGHDLLHLDELVRIDLSGRAASADRPYVQLLLERQTSDPYWADILRALNAWADQAGRYRDLTILTGAAVPELSPSAIWEELEMHCVRDLGILSDIGGPNAAVHLATVRMRLAQSIILWWSAIFRCWTHGLLGQSAVAPGSALNPATADQLSTDLARFARAL